MVHILLKGVLLGLTISVLLGPVFFTLIQTSIHRGFRSGFLLALGISCSDSMLIMLCYLGASRVIYNPHSQLMIGIIGGGIMITFGIVTFMRKAHEISNQDADNIEIPLHMKVPGAFTFIVKGFFLNLLNPFVWIFWIGVVSAVTPTFRNDDGRIEIQAVFLFFVFTLGTILSADIFKCFVANKIKQYLNPKFMTVVNRIVGIFLVIFGILLLIKVIFKINV